MAKLLTTAHEKDKTMLDREALVQLLAKAIQKAAKEDGADSPVDFGDAEILARTVLAAQGEAAVAVKPLAPPASAKVVGKWEIDNSTPSPILMYEKCSVIQDEQAHYVLGLIQADVSPASGVSEAMVEAAKALDLHLDKLICYASTCYEYEPNKAVRDFRNALEAALANGDKKS